MCFQPMLEMEEDVSMFRGQMGTLMATGHRERTAAMIETNLAAVTLALP